MLSRAPENFIASNLKLSLHALDKLCGCEAQILDIETLTTEHGYLDSYATWQMHVANFQIQIFRRTIEVARWLPAMLPQPDVPTRTYN